MNYFIGLDVGTTGAKAVLIDQKGKVLATSNNAYPMYTPHPLWAEQNPKDWWQAAQKSIRQAIKKAKIKQENIKGVGLTGQMHGLVLLDKEQKVLRPCIMWNDQRTAVQCNTITKKIGFDEILKITGNQVLPGFTLPKILWVRKNEPEIYSRIAHILLPKDYIRFKLTGEFATEVSDASGTTMLDVGKRIWSKRILSELDISSDWLPKVFESQEITGIVKNDVAKSCGLFPGTPVVGGGGDQAAGAVGTGTVKQGIVSVVLGTSGVVFAHMDQFTVEPHGNLHAFGHSIPNAWHVMGVTLSAAGSFRWFRDVFGKEEIEAEKNGKGDAYELLVKQASKVKPGSEGLVFLPYLTGERTPYPDPNARGTFTGITVRQNKAHFIRSILEGVAFSLKDCLQLIDSMNVTTKQIRISGGGARSGLWKQIIADVLEKEIITMKSTEGAPYGAAILAAVGCGEFDSVEQACKIMLEPDTQTIPQEQNIKSYKEIYNVYRDLYPALKPSFNKLASIKEI